MEKVGFVMAVEAKEANIAELCRRFGISRQTGYEVLERHRTEGYEGLRERSHAPRTKPHAMSEAVKEMVLKLRRERPSWGPKKLKAYLERLEGAKAEAERLRMPAASSMGDLLKQEGLIVKRRKRPGGQVPSSEPLGHADEPNRVWSIDYKGHFKTGDGRRCEPLTVTGNESRYLLKLVAMSGIQSERVRAVMEAAFRENGLPEAIRSDNGAPFASNAPGGVTQLSLWWERLGIRHERIEPGKPQQNGRHERFHLSLLRDRLDGGVAWDLRAQQRVFERYQHEFNEERPHEALEMRTPADRYRASAKRYDGQNPEFEYGEGFQTRRVYEQGTILWAAERIPISPVLAGENIGLREEEEDLFAVYCGRIFLGWLENRTHTFVREDRAERWAKKKTAE
jgi:transposase InsO family protein